MSHDNASSKPHSEHVSVMGQATIDVVPDLVEIAFSLQRIDATASAAKEIVDDRARRALGLATELGIAAIDVTASHVSIAPHREYRNSEYLHKGYAAERTVVVRLRELEHFNRLIDGLVAIPVDRIRKIERALQDPAAADREALTRAIADAKDKAACLAAAFGVELGPVYSVQHLGKEERFHIGGAAARSETGGNDAVFEPGTIEVEARVEVTFFLSRPFVGR